MAIKINGDNTVANPGFSGDDTDTGLQVGTDELKLVTGGTARATVDSSGRLLLGTTTEGEPNADNLTIADSGNCGITLRSGTSNYGAIYFSDATSGNGEFDGYIDYNQTSQSMRFGTASTAKVYIDSSGNVIIGKTSAAGTGTLTFVEGTTVNWENTSNTRRVQLYGDSSSNFVVETAGSERMRILSSGGLTFNGDTAAANALDDYEEGSFTITTSGISNLGTLQTARYIKIGNLVTYMWNIYQNSNNMSWSAGSYFSITAFTPISNFHTSPSISWFKSASDSDTQPAYFSGSGDIVLNAAQSNVRHLWGFVTIEVQ